MTTATGLRSEWSAAPLRPIASWVPVTGPDGRTRLEMVWSVPAVDLAGLSDTATGTSTAA